MPEAPDPESLPPLEMPGAMDRYGAQAFERRIVDGFPPSPGKSARSLAWVRSRSGRFDKALLAMVTDNSPPRVMYALGRDVDSTTLSLTAYLHATDKHLAEIGDDFILIECDGQVGNDGASDERSNYWRRDGRLLATSTQLAWYRAAAREMPE
jgi:acyl-CoA thioesterase